MEHCRDLKHTHLQVTRGLDPWGVELASHLCRVILERCRGHIPPLSSHILDSLQPCMSHDIRVAARSTEWGSDYEVPSKSAIYSTSASVQGDEAEIVILTPQRAPGAVEDPGVSGEGRQRGSWGRVRVTRV